MNGECEMRKRMRKPLAFLLTLLMLVSVMGSSALAEDTSPTGTAAAQEDETGTQADTGVTENEEDAEKQISAQEAGGSEADLTEYIPSEQPEGVSVKAYAAQGVLPEGTTLTVKKLEEGDPTGQYAEAEQALQDSALEYDGFLAMDISFLDADGNEIEPEADKVRVEMEVDSTALPEGAEASTIAVQHLAETEEGISVETVADAADAAEGTVEVSDEKMKAEFSVESFSTFTITYVSGWYSKTVYLVDSQGNEILGNVSLGSESLRTSDGWQSIENVAADCINQAETAGYTYEGAYIGTSANPQQTPFQWIKVRQTGSGWSTSYELRYSNNDSKPGSGNNGDDISNNEIYLVFSQQGGGSQPGGGDTPADITPGYRKYVAANGDGTFNLTLDVTGGISSTTQKALVDVVFVLDVSGSMDDKISQNSRTTKLQSARSAINTMVTSLSGNKDIDARYALVTFSGNWGYETYDDASVARSWTQNVNQFTSALNGTNADGGTNYEAGLREANTLLGSKRANASTVVVFVSDGNPTFYYNDQGYTAGNGGSYDATAMSHAQAQVGAMSANFFFTVGVGSKSEYDRLENLKDSASEGTTTGHYAGTDETELKKAFDDIESKITYYRFSNVGITDVLSENVSLTENSTLQITVKNKEGKTVISGDDSVTFSSGEQSEVRLTASYDSALKQITLNFPDNYELEDGWTYQVTAQIEPTEKAYENYRNNGNTYPDTGADNTDEPGLEESVWISSGKGGVYTNEAKSAILEYTYNGESKTAEYPMPVIPLNPGTLVIEKKITGLEEDTEALKTLAGQLEFTYSLNSGTAPAVSLADFTKGEDGVYRYEIAGLSPNTSYEVNEQNADLEASGYRLTEDSDTAEKTGTVAGGDSVTAAFTNKYEPAQRTLTIAKTVDGNMGDKNKDFAFTLSLEKNSSAYTEAIAYTKGETTGVLTAESGEYSFTLRHGESIVLTLPYGCEYTVTETNGNYDVTITPEGGTPIESHVLTGTLTEDTEAAFLNELDVNTPTGLFRTIAPYVIMTGTALGAILLFILRRRRLS